MTFGFSENQSKILAYGTAVFGHPARVQPCAVTMSVLRNLVFRRKIVLRGKGSDGLYARGVLLCTPRAFFYLVQFYEYKSS